MPVTVSHDSGNWIIAGKRNKITINEKMAKLHERVAFLEMTKHEFLDPNYKQERPPLPMELPSQLTGTITRSRSSRSSRNDNSS